MIALIWTLRLWLTRLGQLVFLVCIFLGMRVHAKGEDLATLEISGLRSGEGHVAISIFSKENQSAFPDKADQAFKSYYIEIENEGLLRVPLSDLPPGSYSIAIMHDEDSNGKFRSGLFGIPQEGFGFSNNPKIYFGPPGFESAVVELEAAQSIPVQMKYFL